MLSKCANPNCSEQLRYLRDGKIFRVEPPVRLPSGVAVSSDLPSAGTEARPVQLQVISRSPSVSREYFWLCAACARSLTIGVQDQKVVVMPTRPVVRTAAAS